MSVPMMATSAMTVSPSIRESTVCFSTSCFSMRPLMPRSRPRRAIRFCAVAAPLGQRVLQPEEVVEAAEADVEALGRHAHGDRLDLHVGRRLGHFQLRRSERLGQRLIGRLAQIVQPQDAVLLHRHAERFGAQVQAQFVAKLGVGRLGLLFLPASGGSAAGQASSSR